MTARMQPTLIGVLLGVALLLAGCGGGHKSSSSTTSSSTTSGQKSSGKHTGTKTSGAKKSVSLGVLIASAKSGSPPSANATASTGDPVQFITHVPGDRNAKAVPVQLNFSQDAPTKWTVTASVKNHQATATLTSKNGKPIPLAALNYGCALPPAPTFCPVSNVHTSHDHISAQFTANPGLPIVIGATVGPLPNAPASPPHSTVIAPTYKIKMSVASVPKKHSGSARAKPGPTASVHPGDVLAISVHLGGAVVGATQPLTLSFSQGPAKSITVSASVPGGTPAKATFNSATGSPIAIVLPRYHCGLPPSPTFCPLSKIVAASRSYTLTIDASPKTPPISIQAEAQAG
jgi:hypothetical protein